MTSSITTVTEEDLSDESDTTESSNSKLSDSISSIMYSSECNTDDKLTTSLVNISISNQNNNCESKKRTRNVGDNKIEEEYFESVSSTSSAPCHQSSFADKKKRISQAKKKHKSFHSTALTKYVLQKRLSSNVKNFLPKQKEEDFGYDDPNNCDHTDFSDTSTVLGYDKRQHQSKISSMKKDNFISTDDNQEEAGEKHRPYHPDLNSSLWFQAKCFDRYWSHYGFVMEWYRQHVLAVNVLSQQMYWPNLGMQTSTYSFPTKPNSKKKKTKRAKNRARNRRLAKARSKASQAAMQEEATKEVREGIDSEAEESELEMEITDEMMNFFATSFKHRMERDGKKKEDASNGNDKENGNCPEGEDSLAPLEQPGVRRTAEMKALYGEGAPMIQGMETALQMTYDKVLDRNRPKLWPNMPLKIKFN